MPHEIYRLRTIVCSPWAGDTTRNRAYAQQAMLDSLRHNEAPFLSHLLYTQVLDDTVPEERAIGLECEAVWLTFASQVVLYCDLGTSPGMVATRKKAYAYGIKIKHRRIADSLPAGILP